MSTQGIEQGGYLQHGHLRGEFHLRRKTKEARKDAAQCRVDRSVCAQTYGGHLVMDAHIHVL